MECQLYLFNVLLQINQTLQSILMSAFVGISSFFFRGKVTFTKQLSMCQLFLVKFSIINNYLNEKKNYKEGDLEIPAYTYFSWRRSQVLCLEKRSERKWVDYPREASPPFGLRERRIGDVIYQSPSLLLIDLFLPLSEQKSKSKIQYDFSVQNLFFKNVTEKPVDAQTELQNYPRQFSPTYKSPK